MRTNPYTDLKDRCAKWAITVVSPHTRGMWRYPREKLATGFRLDDLYERIRAADQLGYDVRLRAEDDGLHVEYVKRPGMPPYEIRP